MKVAILFDHIGPYHVARLDAAARVCEVTGVSGGVISKDYAWRNASGVARCPIREINNEGAGSDLDAGDFRKRLHAILHETDPDVVLVPGWSGRQAFEALHWARSRWVPVVIMSESTAWDEKRVAWKEWIKRRFLALSSAALVGGKPHRNYLQQLGMPPERIFEGYDVIDNSYFEREAAVVRAAGSPVVPPYFLASNRFIPKKNLFRLLDSYSAYERETAERAGTASEAWNLCLLGDGDLRNELLGRCERLGLQPVFGAPWERDTRAADSVNRMVFFPGFRQIDELPRFYAMAGAFIHASTTEQWGLVVNEAMASGLPVLVSNRCGCASDLVEEGVNGFTFDPHDSIHLASLMAKVSEPDFPRSRFSSAGKEIISGWSPERFASGLRSATLSAVAFPAKSYSSVDRCMVKLLASR